MVSSRVVVLLAVVIAFSCAPQSGRGAIRNSNFISQDELAGAQHSNLYDAIYALRPTFLRSRGRHSFDPGQSEFPLVYQDGQRYGELDVLKGMSLETVKSVRFLSASDATTKYGTNHTSGVIEVTTR